MFYLFSPPSILSSFNHLFFHCHFSFLLTPIFHFLFLPFPLFPLLSPLLPFHVHSTLYSSIFSSFFPSSFLHHPSIFSSFLYTSFFFTSFLFHLFFPFLSILSSSFTLFPWFFISSPSHIFLFSQVPLPENSFKRQHPQIFPHCLA